MWICKKCGTNNSDNSNFCSNCGNGKTTNFHKCQLEPKIMAILATALVITLGTVGWAVGAKIHTQKDVTPTPTAIISPTVSYVPTTAPTIPPTPEPTPIPTTTPTPEPISEETIQKTPSVEDVRAFGSEITYPKSSSYLSSYETMYVKSEKGHSIYVYWKAQGSDEYRRKYYLYEKDEVVVLAREKGFSCVIFTASNGEQHLGWVSSAMLVYEY